MIIPHEDLLVESILLHGRSPGGQQVCDGKSGVRVTHIPTGTAAEVHDRRSGYENRKAAEEMIEWALASK